MTNAVTPNIPAPLPPSLPEPERAVSRVPKPIILTPAQVKAKRSGPPWFGIPIPGRRPFLVRREKLYIVTRDMTIDSAVLVPNPDWDRHCSPTAIQPSTHWYTLEIKSHCASMTLGFRPVRNVSRFLDQGKNLSAMKLRMQIESWAASQRKRVTSPKLDKYDRAIAKLNDEIQSLEYSRPKCLFMAAKPKPSWARPDSHAWESWKAHRRFRKRAAKIAGHVLMGRLTPAEGYKALRSAGLHPMHSFSELGAQYSSWTPQRFWKSIWSFLEVDMPGEKPITTNLARNPRPEDKVSLVEQLKAHNERRRDYLATQRQVNSLKSQIAAIKIAREDKDMPAPASLPEEKTVRKPNTIHLTERKPGKPDFSATSTAVWADPIKRARVIAGMRAAAERRRLDKLVGSQPPAPVVEPPAPEPVATPKKKPAQKKARKPVKKSKTRSKARPKAKTKGKAKRRARK